MSAPRGSLAVASGAVLLAAADTYVVVVALPAIMAGVGIGLDELARATPVVSGFLLGYVAVLPLLGRLSDLAGRRPVLLGCLATFALGSLLTATAHTLSVLVAGRALQGLGGGGLVPVTLSLVAAGWPAERRGLPLGVVGGVQELGSVLGPLWGALLVAVSTWRAIFWVNLPLVGLLAVAFATTTPPPARRPGRLDVVGITLLSLGAVALVVGLWAPRQLAGSVTWGTLVVPRAGGATWVGLSDPLALAGMALLVVCAAWEALAPVRVRRLADPRHLGPLLAGADLPGAALLAGALACVVVICSTADPSRQTVASSTPVLAPLAAVLAVAFALRQRRARRPLIRPGLLSARPAWGALVVNLAIGAGLIAALVDVPLFARATRYPASELGAALELVQLLVAVPIGAVLGGLALRRGGPAPGIVGAGAGVSALAFATMAGWGPEALGGAASTVELVVCGLGFGLVIAPVNAAVLAHVDPDAHGLAGALAVVARTVGMLVGLSVLTAVGLRRFYEAVGRIGSPTRLCPTHPGSCPAYTHAATGALLAELHTIFAGAAISCGIAAVAGAVLLRPVGPSAPVAPAVLAGTP